MNLPAVLGERKISVRMLVWGLLGGTIAAALALPYAYLVSDALWLAVPAAITGYLPRRSRSDALFLALPVLAAHLLEPGNAPQVLACLILTSFALTTRPRFSAFIGSALLLLLMYALYLKLRFAGTRLTWQDIHFFFAEFADNAVVLGSQPTLVAYAAAALLGVAVIAAAGWAWDQRGRHKIHRPRAWAAVALSVVVATWSGGLLRAEAMRISEQGGLVVAESPGAYLYPLSHFLATVFMAPRWTAPSVPTGEFVRISGQYAAPLPHGRPADIVVFLQESQFNPATIAGCPERLCRLPGFEADPRTVAHGPMQVHVFGGGTWTSEFAVAAGVPHKAFGPAGDFVPFSVAPAMRQSFVRSLKAAGYRTVAVYPVRGGMMNARLAYAGYGFDAFHDARDLGLTGRFDTTDDDMHAAALRVLEQERRSGQPVFLLALTIFNHGEDGVRMERVPQDTLRQARAAFADPSEAESVADYVWRTGEFQRVLQATSRAILDGPRPAVMAWFGDHQPAFPKAPGLKARVREAAASEGRIPPRFQTWYQVRSSEPGLPPAPQRPLDIVFLPGLLAQAARVPLDPWLAANVAAREECGGLLQQCRRPAVRDAYLSYLRNDLRAFAGP